MKLYKVKLSGWQAKTGSFPTAHHEFQKSTMNSRNPRWEFASWCLHVLSRHNTVFTFKHGDYSFIVSEQAAALVYIGPWCALMFLFSPEMPLHNFSASKLSGSKYTYWKKGGGMGRTEKQQANPRGKGSRIDSYGMGSQREHSARRKLQGPLGHQRPNKYPKLLLVLCKFRSACKEHKKLSRKASSE